MGPSKLVPRRQTGPAIEAINKLAHLRTGDVLRGNMHRRELGAKYRDVRLIPGPEESVPRLCCSGFDVHE